jgi:hypothetical protein
VLSVTVRYFLLCTITLHSHASLLALLYNNFADHSTPAYTRWSSYIQNNKYFFHFENSPHLLFWKMLQMQNHRVVWGRNCQSTIKNEHSNDKNQTKHRLLLCALIKIDAIFWKTVNFLTFPAEDICENEAFSEYVFYFT